MDARNCRSCGSLFNYMGGEPICASCKRKLEEKFNRVKEYLDEKPYATIVEVSEETEVSVKQLKQWIREERLSLSEATDAGITCISCGRPIRTGRFCDKCKIKMQNDFSGAIKKATVVEPVKKKSGGDRMRFLQ